MYEIAILYILNKYDATIYKVSKLIDELFFAFFKSSLGTVNPCLKKLEKLGCVQSIDKMSDGGMLSKIYSITPTGIKHLKDLLLSFKCNNPYHIINEAKIVLCCSDVLNESEYKELRENLLNILEYHKIKLEKGIENKYLNLNELQKQTVEITRNELVKMIEIL